MMMMMIMYIKETGYTAVQGKLYKGQIFSGTNGCFLTSDLQCIYESVPFFILRRGEEVIRQRSSSTDSLRQQQQHQGGRWKTTTTTPRRRCSSSASSSSSHTAAAAHHQPRSRSAHSGGAIFGPSLVRVSLTDTQQEETSHCWLEASLGEGILCSQETKCIASL